MFPFVVAWIAGGIIGDTAVRWHDENVRAANPSPERWRVWLVAEDGRYQFYKGRGAWTHNPRRAILFFSEAQAQVAQAAVQPRVLGATVEIQAIAVAP